MARTYTLHVSETALAGDADALDRAELVRDGFSWGAFLFTALWFFWRRLWIAGLAVLVLLIAFGALLTLLKVPPVQSLIAGLLVSLLIGFEAGSLHRWTLARRGKPAVDVVSALDDEEAETKSFARYLAPQDTEAPASAAAAPTRSAAGQGREPVIGLFPDRERSW